MRKDIEDAAVELDERADRARLEASRASSIASASYWNGYAAACREAAIRVRKLKEDIA